MPSAIATEGHRKPGLSARLDGLGLELRAGEPPPAAYRTRGSTNVAMSPSLASPLPASLSRRVEPTTVAISTASSEAACERGTVRGHGSSPWFHDTPSNVFASRYDSRPSTPYSRPTPDCLNPPKGAKGSCCSVLIITRPACSLVATAFARA